MASEWRGHTKTGEEHARSSPVVPPFDLGIRRRAGDGGVLDQPAVEDLVRVLAYLGQRQEDVVPRALDRHDRGLAAEAAGPAGDLRDVEHEVGALAQFRVTAR